MGIREPYYTESNSLCLQIYTDCINIVELKEVLHMCGDPDMITYGAYEDFAWDVYFGNPQLADQAFERHEDVSGWKLGASFTHVPTIALDYLFEAKIAYSFGLYRSAIFCCANLLDLELKRNLIDEFPDAESQIRNETFGQSIARLQKTSAIAAKIEILETLQFVNKVRNRVSVHACTTVPLTRCIEDDAPFFAQPDGLEEYLNADECKEAKATASESGTTPDWLRFLTSKIIWQAKYLIGEYSF